MDRRVILILMFVLLVVSVNANPFVTEYLPVFESSSAFISTGQTEEWFYVDIINEKKNQRIGVNKLRMGEFGIGDEREFFGKMWLVPTFNIDEKWYMCPIVDMERVNKITDLKNGWLFDVEDGRTTCYQYSDTSKVIDFKISSRFSFIVDKHGSTKINVDTTIMEQTPSDTGFGFAFFPENPDRFGKIKLGVDDDDEVHGMADTDKQIPPTKVFEFLDGNQNSLSHFFDWSDMLDVGRTYSEILTIGEQKTLFVGTYGYGESKTISIDPAYNFTTSSASPSWHLINGSFIFNQSVDDYEQKVNVTAGLGDGSDATKYPTRIGTNSIDGFYYQFNDYGLSSAHDSSEHNNDLTIMPQASISPALDIFALECTQVDGGGAQALHKDEFNTGANDFTLGFIVNVTNSTAYSKYLIRKYEFPFGYTLYMDNTWTVRGMFRDSNSTYNGLSSTTTMDDGKAHTIIVRRNITSGLIQLIIDGVVESNGTTPTFGNYDNYVNLQIGTVSASYGFYGYIDEVFMTKQCFSDAQVEDYNRTHKLYNEDKGQSIQVFFDHIFSVSNSSYSLKIKKTNPGQTSARIYLMQNMTHFNSSNYIDTVIAEGFTYANIDSMIYNGYNLPFRIGTLHNTVNISEVSLYEIGNDTTPPHIYDCYVNDSFVDCNDSVTLGCHVVDVDSFVAEAWGTVNIVGLPINITIQAFQDPSDPTDWEVKLSAEELKLLFEMLNWTFDSYLNISMVYMNATDLPGNTQENFSFDVWSIYSCILCTPNWIAQYGTCQVNNSHIKYYFDTLGCNNSFGLPSDNGTWVFCDYCQPDVYKDYTSECVWNGTYYVIDYQWSDYNYFSCCALVTNKTIDDCPTDYIPFNESGTEFCTFLENDFDVTYEATVYYEFLDKKVYWKFNLNDTNNTYKCQSYVQTTSGDLLQVNPTYIKKSSTVINLGSSNIEDRSYFTIENGLGQAYFTQENLIVDGRVYTYGVECSSEGGVIIKSERLVIPLYEPVHEPITRFFWIKENIFGIIMGALLFIMFMWIVAWIIIKLRGR